jgi:hypothetical protein
MLNLSAQDFNKKRPPPTAPVAGAQGTTRCGSDDDYRRVGAIVVQ